MYFLIIISIEFKSKCGTDLHMNASGRQEGKSATDPTNQTLVSDVVFASG